MKVYVHFERGEELELHKTSKLTLPNSWASKRVHDVLQLFVTSYNTKNPSNVLSADQIHLRTREGDAIFSDSTVGEALLDRGDYFVFLGEHTRPAASPKPVETIPETPASLKCKNFGCGKSFTEAENHSEACRHHVGAPLFHDRVKGWTCCKDRKAYDWEEFMQIEGCSVGPHSITPPAQMLAPSPTMVAAAAAAAEANSSQNIRSIHDFNQQNAEAPSTLSSTARIVNTRKSTRQEDGTARCLNKGCLQTFIVAQNTRTSCTYHRGNAVFHDVVKYWSCCEHKKCYDFDEFMSVPGCAVGFHDDGTDEFVNEIHATESEQKA